MPACMLRWLAALAAQPPAWQAELAHVAICHLEILPMPIAHHFAPLEFRIVDFGTVWLSNMAT